MRPYMNVIDAMLAKMVTSTSPYPYIVNILWQSSIFNDDSLYQFREDPSFKPQGGQLGENDMDYDTDEKSMATLRRHLRNAKDEYYRYKRYAELSNGPVLTSYETSGGKPVPFYRLGYCFII